MARYVEQGARVTIAIATNGEVGGPGPDPAAIAANRKKEAEASARLLGASLIWMGFQDEMLFNTKEVREAFIDAYRQARPDVVFVHSTEDYHPDHRTAGQIGLDARIPAQVPHVKTSTSLPALQKIPHLFTFDTMLGVNFEPEYLVDITSQLSLREKLLRAHASQVEWCDIAYGDDYVAGARNLSTMRASGTGWQVAEAFRSVHTYPVTGGPDLLPKGWRAASGGS
jgi:LmbE family N-acetylglucosaminyl deacetylase